MNLWHDVAPHRVRPEDFLAVIEIEKGSKNKYEMDKETGALRLDRILYTSTHYPANYGFIPRTWADDGDPLDVLVLCSEVIQPMSLVRCYPIGVFTMMAWVVATQGPEILGSLGIVLGCAYLGYIVHAVLCYSVSAKAFAGINPITFFKKASPAMIFAFTSTSSAATIPLSMECSEDLGAENDISSFVIPLGATINMDGTAIYQCVATIFLATCCGMTLTLGQMVTIVVTATLASIGTAGTPGAGMIMLAMVLQAMNIPVDMIMIIYGVDRLFDMGRTCLNITGDISCALCVTKWESKRKATAPAPNT